MEKILNNIKHPKELTYFGISRTLERTSYYGIRSLLLIYMTGNALNLSESQSIEIYSYFTIAVMLTPILGAILGDLKLGNRTVSILGILLSIIGTIFLMIPNQYCLYFALSLLALGSGLYIPNFNAQLGKYYLDREKLIDGGFTIIYSLINLGAFLGAIIIGFFQKDMMKYGLIVAVFANLIALIFQLKVKEQSNEMMQNINIKQTNWKVIILVIIGICIYWTASDFIGNY
jgi:POT family proton-dependent oligopeptide transporter